MDYNPLAAFLEEAEETLVPSLAPSSAADEDNEHFPGGEDEDKDRTGHLLLTGCNDWESMTSQKPMGLDSPHLMKFKSPVANVFSSSNSAHFFLTLGTGELYGCGNNLRGQLGLNDKHTRPYPSIVSYAKFVGSKSSKTVVKVATGKAHTLLLMSDGILYTAGAANFGQIGMSQRTGIPPDREKFVKLSEDVLDAACGAEHSMYCTNKGELYSFGHPEYGVLGHGSSGEFFEEGGKKAGLSFNHVYNPTKVDTFLTKDSKGKRISEHSSESVKVTAVSAGKHHSACMLTLLNDDENSFSRVYTWGFGGFGRLGHNCADDELCPRELSFFSSPRTAVRQLICGASYTCAISKQNQFYFWGKLPNSPRGESQMYPKVQQELYDFNVRSVATGSQFLAVATKDSCLAWGRPVGGKFGLQEDAISSVNPKLIESVKDLNIIKLSAGYGHLCFLVDDSDPKKSRSRNALDNFPTFPERGPVIHKQNNTKTGEKKKQLSKSSLLPADDRKKRQKT